MENSESNDFDNLPINQPDGIKANLSLYIKSLKTDKQLLLLSIGIVAIILITFLVLLLNIWPRNTEKSLEVSPTPSVSPTVTILPSIISSTPSMEVTPKPTTAKTTPRPTTPPRAISTPSNTPVPTSVPTATPTATVPATPTPTTRTANPPIIEISYPTSMQTIDLASGQTICVVDTPAGGNTEGLQRKHNFNEAGWTEYVQHYTLCLDPPAGLNTLHLIYRNKFGDESTTYTRQFTINRI